MTWRLLFSTTFKCISNLYTCIILVTLLYNFYFRFSPPKKPDFLNFTPSLLHTQDNGPEQNNNIRVWSRNDICLFYESETGSNFLPWQIQTIIFFYFISKMFKLPGNSPHLPDQNMFSPEKLIPNLFKNI